MSRKIFKRPQAAFDLIEHASYLAQDSFDLADRFIDASEQALARLASMPSIGNVRHFANPKLQGIRSWPIPGFEKYLIFYRPTDDVIDVLRVLHSARDIFSILEEES